MKIQTENQQQAVAQQPVEKHPEPREAAAAAHEKKSAPPATGARDSVELSAALDAELRRQEAEQALRVEELKARIAAGDYEVPSREVAKKILSGRLDT